MIKYTQKQLRGMVEVGLAVNISCISDDEYKELKDKEKYFTQVGYSSGVYGCNGMLIKGYKTGQLYAITSRTQAIYRFG